MRIASFVFFDWQILMNKFLSNIHEEHVLVETIRIHLLPGINLC